MKKTGKLALLEAICSVPGTDEELIFGSDGSARTQDGRHFRSLRGTPILRAEDPVPVTVKPLDHPQAALPADQIAYMQNLEGYTLFLGAGATAFRHPNVVEAEFNLFATTDVVADAHSLPFRSNTFDLVFAMNVFEHLREPHVAAREILRVLRPGGEVHIHTAFLQPLHEEPAHYFNATEFGVRAWFDEFVEVGCTVSPNFNPLYALAWFTDELLRITRAELGDQAAQRLQGLSLGEVATFWQQQNGWNPAALELFRGLSEEAQRRIAAGFELRARKPGARA